MREHLNCPNCGAPIEGSRCGYCGTVFLDFGCLEIAKPMWLRMKLGSSYNMVRVIMTRISVDMSTGPELYADNTILSYARAPSLLIRPEFISLPANESGLISVKSKDFALDESQVGELHLNL